MNYILLLGIVTGARTMTAMAVLCWAAWLGFVPEHGWAIWITYLVSAVVFTVLALGEYIGDTLPSTPSRKAAFPAVARLGFGALVGALAATMIYQPLAGGILTGLLGAAIGTWGGYALRMASARRMGRDLPAALIESALAIALAVFSVWRLHQGIVIDMKRGAV